jgi:hypothetical protein
MKLLFLIICVLCLVHHGQSAMIATANLHVDSTSVAVGILLFYQQDANSPVRIAGVLEGLKNNTVHVNILYERKKNHLNIIAGFSCTQRSINEGCSELYSCWSSFQSI